MNYKLILIFISALISYFILVFYRHYFEIHRLPAPPIEGRVESHMPEDSTGAIKVLVYPGKSMFGYTLKEVGFEGNYKQICNLTFDCLFKQHHKHEITAHFLQSMDSILLCQGGINYFRKDLEKLYGAVKRYVRDPKQIWATMTAESVKNFKSTKFLNENPELNRLFNWTLFTSKNATIHQKYFYIYKKEKNENDIWINKYYSTTLTNKTNDFCWMVTNCNMVWNNRFLIANNLIGNLSSVVHLWGQAQKRKCLKPHSNLIDHGPVAGLYYDHYDVVQKRIKDCKFYFAFENSNCSDYVTEKFLNAIESGAIPIVNGWPQTYKDLLPGSYIHVRDFTTESQLAEYLESLLKDTKKLKKYHEWRKFYRYERNGYKMACSFCRKLEQLNKSDGW